MKDQLIFDTFSDSTISDSDSVGVYLRAGDDGTLITHTGFEADDHDQPSSIDFVDGDVTVASDAIAETDHGYNTGDKGQLTTTGTLPAGLALATDYYIIRVDKDTIKLASSLANAIAGTAVDITAAAGGGTHTFTVSTAYKQMVDVILPRLEQIEDSAHVSGDRGIMSLAVRNDTEGSLVGADGDYAPLQVDSSGRLRVIGDLDVSNLSEKNEDAAHSSGDVGDFVLSVRMDDVDGSNAALLAGTEGDYQGVFTNAKGELHVRDNDAVDLLTTIDTDTGVIAGDTTSMDATLTALSKAEDAAHSSGDQGIMSLAVRNDTKAALAGTSGDYIPFQMNASGELYVKDEDMLTELQSITHAEDVAHVSGDVGVMSLAVRNDTLAALAGTDGDYAPLQVNASGALYVKHDGDLDVNDTANTSIANAVNTLAVASTAEDVVASPLSNRKYLYIYNNDNRRMFVGATGVTASNGFPIAPRSYLELRAGASIDIEYVSPKASHEIRTLELS